MRATWIMVICAIAVSALLAEILALTISALADAANGAQGGSPGSGSGSEFGAGSASDADELQDGRFPLGAFVVGSVGSFITLVLLGVVAAQAFGQDYRHGTIRLTLTLFPRRVNVFWAKAIVMSAVVVAAYAVSMVVATLVAMPNGRAVDFNPDAAFFAIMGRAMLYMIGFGLIAFAISALTRILALGVIIPVVLAVIAEPLLVALQYWVSWLPNILPFTAGQGFMGGTDMWRNGLVYLAWVVALLAAAQITFIKRDA